MRVLVTGASGLVGGHLCRLLLEGGFTVRALLPPASEPPSLEGLAIERAEGTVLDPESLQGSLAGVRAVFHCACVLALEPPRANWIAQANVQGTRNLLVAMARGGVEDLVHVGSASSFGYGTMEEPGCEESPYAGARFRLACFDSARAAQDMVERYNRDGRIRGVIANPTLALGPFDCLPGPGRELFRAAECGSSRYPSGGANVIGARDAARAVLKALGRGRPGHGYILGGWNVSYEDLLSKLASARGAPGPDKRWSDSAVMLRGAACSLLKAVRRKPALTIETARLATTGMYYSSERADVELGLELTPLESVIEEAYGWYAGNRDDLVSGAVRL